MYVTCSPYNDVKYRENIDRIFIVDAAIWHIKYEIQANNKIDSCNRIMEQNNINTVWVNLQHHH